MFLTASADASRVFFTSETGGPLEECVIVSNENGELQCNATGKPLDLTPGAVIDAPLPGASEDASYVYFVSTGVLSGEEQDGHGEKAQAGQPNMYVLHEGTISLVAVLSPADSPDWGNNRYIKAGTVKQVEYALLGLTARVSPDGRWLAFSSERSLTGYDNHDAASGQPDQEVFLYHAPATGGGEAGSLVCASCNPTGGRPHGVEYRALGFNGPDAGNGEIWPHHQWLAASLPGWSTILYQSRYLTDGGQLFFNSSDAPGGAGHQQQRGRL